MRTGPVWLALSVLLIVGCGNGGNGDNGNGECATVSGTWTITEHCSSDVIGNDISISQIGCSLTVNWGGSQDWEGSVSGNTMTTSGDRGDGVVLTCTGTLSADSWTSDCTPEACHVVVKKN